LTVGLIIFKRRSANGFASKADVVATTAIAAVVVAASGEGKYFSCHGISGFGSGFSSTTTVVGAAALGISGGVTSGVGGAGTLGTSAGRVIIKFSGV
tara:strand:- start:292 stop:582 length:291 start_codon:yes stop_codon:yes gene_type:complete